MSLYGDKVKPKTYAARFASPDGYVTDIVWEVWIIIFTRQYWSAKFFFSTVNYVLLFFLLFMIIRITCFILFNLCFQLN